jgi:hypothetical protein
MWLVLLVAAALVLPISLGILTFKKQPKDSDLIHPGF